MPTTPSARRLNSSAALRSVSLFCATIACALLAACGGEQDAGDHPSTSNGGRLLTPIVTADKQDPTTLDPALMWDAYDAEVGAFVHQGLVKFGAGTDIVPALAESWEIAEDGLSATFKLRDAEFHNGASLSAYSVKYSVLRVLDPAVGSQRGWIFAPYLKGHDDVESGASTEYVKHMREKFAELENAMHGPIPDDIFEGVEVLADDEVRFHFNQPYMPFLTMLAMPNAAIVPLGSAEDAIERGTTIAREPIGAGPWKLTSWTPGERLDFKAFDEYWEGRSSENGLVWRVIGETSTWRAEFEAGNVDFYQVSAADFREWRMRPDRRDMMRAVPELNIYFLGFNTTKAPFDDARVRRALAMSVNRAEILEYIELGRGELASGPVPPTIAGAASGLPTPAYDPEAARALLADAGASDLSVAVYLTNDRHNMALMEAVKANWEEIGATVTLRSLDRAAYNDARRRGEHDVYFSNWWADYPDVDNFVFPLFHSDNIGGANGTGYSDPEVDALIDEARFSADADARLATFAEVQRHVVEASPMVFLWHRSSTIAVSEKIDGFEPHPMLNGVDFHSVSKR